MARRRFQKGQLKLVGDKWIGRWREDVIEQGVVRRIRRKVLLGTTKDYPTKRLARRALDEQLVSINRLDYRPMLQVEQSAWRGKLGEPKTEDSIRVVEISPQACERLRGYLQAWRPNERRLLFATRNGTPWNQDMVLKRSLRPLCRKLDIRLPHGNGFHAFRHANATLMNSFGASLKLRQERLGHAQGSRVTETIYTHVISEDARRIAEQLGEAVWGRILDPRWTQEAKRPSVESAKPFQIN